MCVCERVREREREGLRGGLAANAGHLSSLTATVR